MSKLIILTKVLLKNGTGTEGKKKNKLMLLLIIGGLALAFAPLIVELVIFLSKGYDLLTTLNQEGILLSLGLTVSSLLIFFFGIFYTVNTFYFAEDIESLLPMPLKPWHIIGAKFITVTIYEYLTEAIIMLPLLIVFGVKSGASGLYYLYGAIIYALLPLIPLIIASVIVMIIMRFSNIAKNKDRFKLVGGIVAMFLAIGLNMGMQKFMGSVEDPMLLQKMLMEGNNSLIRMSSKLFPTTEFAAKTLVNSNNIAGLSNWLIFLGISAFFTLAFLYLAERLYFKGVIGVSESSAKRKVISSEEFDRSVVKRSAIGSYFLKELRILFRTPIYFMNCVLMNFLWPVFLLIPMITQPEIMNDLGQLKDFIRDGNSAGYILAGSFAFVLFITATNGVSSTSISREGETLFVNKYLPISYMDQIIAKVLSGVLMGVIGMATLVITAVFLLHPPTYLVLLILLTGILGIIFSAFTGMILDLYNPKLNWDNEQKAVKQNLNVIFNMLIGIVFAGLSLLVIFTLKLSLNMTVFLIIGIYGLLDIALYKFLSTQGVKIYYRLEG